MVVRADVSELCDLMWCDTVLCGCVVRVASHVQAGLDGERQLPDRVHGAGPGPRSALSSSCLMRVVVALTCCVCVCVCVCFAEGDWGIEISYNFTW